MMPARPGSRIIRGDDLARFWSKTEADGECIIWTGSTDPEGYGKFATGPAGAQKHHRAHRWIYAQLVQSPAPPLLRHSCDNPSCVNTNHLSPGTQRDNVHDAMQRRRRPVSLDEQMVRRLRAERAAGRSVRKLAERLRVPYQTAYAAARGITWQHVA